MLLRMDAHYGLGDQDSAAAGPPQQCLQQLLCRRIVGDLSQAEGGKHDGLRAVLILQRVFTHCQELTGLGGAHRHQGEVLYLALRLQMEHGNCSGFEVQIPGLRHKLTGVLGKLFQHDCIPSSITCPPPGGPAGEGQTALGDGQAQLVGDSMPAKAFGYQRLQNVGHHTGGQAGGVGV